jgi:hypothetical protein
VTVLPLATMRAAAASPVAYPCHVCVPARAGTGGESGGRTNAFVVDLTGADIWYSCGDMDAALWGMCAANTARELDESPENWIGGFEQGP